ncbi:MerR family transcriptional regulator [Bacillus sp. BP-3]|uniref:MerR family transcriptional regulator n=1 Tax=Bacillus sp. BP-3 TaxID=3022773 RepID=UPI002330B2B0|nr:MerR family transcriptional regulator [Bacillus sp. BP-3]MDC2865818.1 MerR family transcriptional regulator [Bacillus sp. BP-3]
MYTITEFSRICKISTRMLRHYDQEKILKPAYVNPINGYRYYEQGQLEVALQIKKLREYRFPLSKIKIILQAPDKNSLIKHMKLQIMELSHEVRQHLQVISEMSEMINRNMDIISTQRRHYDILIGMRSEITVITQRLQVDINDIDEHFDLLYEKAQVNNFQIIGSPSAIFYDEEYIPDHSDIELRIPINYENTGNVSLDWEIKKLTPHQIVTTLHHGNYDDIGYGYMALEEWVKNNGYLTVATPCEVYLKGPECDCPVEDYVTQICFLIFKK